MRLIDADALYVELECTPFYKCNSGIMRQLGNGLNKRVTFSEKENLLKWKDILAVLDDSPTIEAEPVRHGKWVHVKKHLWHKRENGEVDEWVLDHGYHNGPGCEVCGASVCMHCNPDWAETECRIGYYVCSACEQPARTGNTNYCPHCGAKMDAKEEAK